MNIFSSLKDPKQVQLAEDKAIAEKRGMSLQEYYAYLKQKREEEFRKESEKLERLHKEYLKENHITEEQYQRRERWKKRKEIFKERIQTAFEIVLIIAFCIGVYFVFNDKSLQRIVLSVIVGGVLLVVLGVILYIAWSLAKDMKEGVVAKTFATILLTIGIIVALGVVIYIIGSLPEHGYYYMKMRPDRF